MQWPNLLPQHARRLPLEAGGVGGERDTSTPDFALKAGLVVTETKHLAVGLWWGPGVRKLNSARKTIDDVSHPGQRSLDTNGACSTFEQLELVGLGLTTIISQRGHQGIKDHTHLEN
jgi:hypothetical protein